MIKSRRRTRTRYHLIGLVILACAGILPILEKTIPWRTVAPTAEEQTAPFEFGFPQGARKENRTLRNPFFTTSYNEEAGGPTWVAWRLKKEDIGDTPRQEFHEDTNLPWGWRINPSVYNGSGFDRGHQCNHADRSSSPEASKATFAMSNMLPQAPNLNRRTWELLEEYCRKLAKRGDTLYIVCGGRGVGGTGAFGKKERLENRVTVPTFCWKVILLTDRNNQPKQIIAVSMPNHQDIHPNWQTYLTTAAEIEKETGLTFFPGLPDSSLKNRIWQH